MIQHNQHCWRNYLLIGSLTIDESRSTTQNGRSEFLTRFEKKRYDAQHFFNEYKKREKSFECTNSYLYPPLSIISFFSCRVFALAADKVDFPVTVLTLGRVQEETRRGFLCYQSLERM